MFPASSFPVTAGGGPRTGTLPGIPGRSSFRLLGRARSRPRGVDPMTALRQDGVTVEPAGGGVPQGSYPARSTGAAKGPHDRPGVL
jgi:hypothetical protein